MKTFLGQLRKRLLGLSREEITYNRRGFRGATDAMQARLEKVGTVFLDGYHAALEHGHPEKAAFSLNFVEQEMRGFAFEGAAMAFSILDTLTPWKGGRIERFLTGSGQAHLYMIHVAVGWVWARVPFGVQRTKRRMDPLLGWLAYDGWGFHEGFFHWPNYIHGQPAPRSLAGYARRVFDQGLGRSFWFVNGGNAELIAKVIGDFPSERQSDLWSGLGLAATYAGIVDKGVLEELREKSGQYRPALAQGAAFAAKARHRAGNATGYTDLASRVLSGLSSDQSAQLCDTTLENLPANDAQPNYELWRLRIQAHLQQLPQPARI